MVTHPEKHQQHSTSSCSNSFTMNGGGGILKHVIDDRFDCLTDDYYIYKVPWFLLLLMHIWESKFRSFPENEGPNSCNILLLFCMEYVKKNSLSCDLSADLLDHAFHFFPEVSFPSTGFFSTPPTIGWDSWRCLYRRLGRVNFFLEISCGLEAHPPLLPGRYGWTHVDKCELAYQGAHDSLKDGGDSSIDSSSEMHRGLSKRFHSSDQPVVVATM